MSMQNDPHGLDGLDAFELSRIGALADVGPWRLRCGRAQGSGPGVRIDTDCDGQALAFWVPETVWCSWIAPQLPVPALAAVDADLLPPLASWSLAPLDALLATAGMRGCGDARISAAPAPDAPCWLFGVEADAARLPLFLLAAPDDWRRGVLSALQPDPERRLTLALGLGWCWMAPAQWCQVRVGDALAVEGAAGGSELRSFWLHPARSPGLVQLEADGELRADAAAGAAAAPAGALCIAVEVGEAGIAAAALAAWRPGATLAWQSARHPMLRLVAGGQLLALGELLWFDDGWAVRIAAMADAAPGAAGQPPG